MKIPIKQAFQRHLEHEYSLRLHMFVILLATTLSGVLLSKLLLFFDVVDFRVRYPLAVVFSYLVFFICIRLWLSCITSFKQSKTSVSDWIDIPTPSPQKVVEKVLPAIRGGGGQFSGAGASAAFDTPDATLVEASAVSDLPTPQVGAPKGIGNAVGEAVGALGDDNIIVAAIVLVVLIVTILVSAIFLLYGAPAILAEAAFQGVLAASLIRRTRTISDEAWAGSILKHTWKPFAGTIGVAFLCGVVLHAYFPHASKLVDILWRR